VPINDIGPKKNSSEIFRTPPWLREPAQWLTRPRAENFRRKSALEPKRVEARALNYGKPRQNATQANCGADPDIGAIGSRNVFGQARAAAEAELELTRARAVLEAVLTRAGITAEWNGGPEQGTALIHVLPELQRLERDERRAFNLRHCSRVQSSA
jgi:hypothetical protein